MSVQDVRLILDSRNTVGESAVWDDRTGRLLWVDIIPGRIHALDPATGNLQIWQTPDLATSIGLREDGNYVVGLRRRVTIWDGGETFKTLAELEPDLPGNRLNEGVVGPDGAFWVGTMQNNIAQDGSAADVDAPTGSLYRVAPDGTVTRLSDDRFSITNTMVWTDDGRFITADTLANALYAYRIADGRLTDRRTLLEGFARGLPDGSCSDASGTVWNARVGGGACLARLDPSGGDVTTVELPCTWPTSCAFGGPDLSTLFITSARFTMTPDHLAQNPQEGGLFALKTDVAGRPPNRMAS